MNFAEYKYIDCAFGGANNRNNVMDINTVKVPKQPDCYRTVFRFDETYLDYFNKTKSVSGYNDKCYADWLPFDIDDSCLENSYNKTKEAIERLRLDYEIDVTYLFFSGSKGFHILLPIKLFGDLKPSLKLPAVFKNIAKDMLGDTADNIYDINRLFRFANTVNSKSGLYKIPLLATDFNNGIGKITELAKRPQKANFPSMNDCVINKQLVELYQKYLNFEPQRKKSENLWKAFQGGVGEGERNAFTTKLVGYLHGKGVKQDVIYNIISGWNKGNDPPLSDAEIKTIIKSVTRYENKESNLEKDIFPIWGVHDEYAEFVKSPKKVNLGIPEFDEKIRGVRPGQVLTILGFTGNYKTITLQSLMSHYYKYSGEPVLMFEMEMSRLDLFERAVQMEYGIAGSTTENIFMGTDEQEKLNIIGAMEARQKHFYVVDKPGLSFQDMRKYLQITEEYIVKKKVGLVGIDFLQLMTGVGSTRVQMMDYVAKELKNFAKAMDVPIIAVSQVTDVEDEKTEINLMSVRDSKTFIQTSDYVIGIWLDSSGQQVMRLCKNRKGGVGKVYRKIDRENLRFEIT